MTNPQRSLVPAAAGAAPNYWCTWSTQNYTLAGMELDGRPVDAAALMGEPGCKMAREHLDERLLFGPEGWTRTAFDKVRADLYLLLDDGWDVARGVHPGADRWRFGSLELDEARFPSCAGSPQERLARLSALARAQGWRGAAVWLAAQVTGDGRTPGALAPQPAAEAFWRERARWCRAAGIEYWKVDWGARCHDIAFRRMLAEIALREAPDLVVEHAWCMDPLNGGTAGEGRFRDGGDILPRCEDLLAFSPVLRAYDTVGQFSTVSMLDRVASLLEAGVRRQSHTLLNAEDEAYLAAALGCTLGVMRHPRWRMAPGQRHDPRQVARRSDEVVRAIRWQRIAPPSGCGLTPVAADSNALADAWFFEEGDTWCGAALGREVVQRAPARVARGMELPVVRGTDVPPYVVASRHPNGAVAVATLPRILRNRAIETPAADVEITIPDAARPLGIFGVYRSLTLRLAGGPQPRRVLAQDLAGEVPQDITPRVAQRPGALHLDGALLAEIGRSAGAKGDPSDPGLVIQCC